MESPEEEESDDPLVMCIPPSLTSHSLYTQVLVTALLAGLDLYHFGEEFVIAHNHHIPRSKIFFSVYEVLNNYVVYLWCNSMYDVALIDDTRDCYWSTEILILHS